MNDREIFRRNLNHYLNINGYMQRDLADAIGAKYTTVSGWTRGISYPRADAMEKIAMFFGIPTSELVSENLYDNDGEQTNGSQQSDKVRVLVQNITQLQPDEFDQLNDMFYVLFKRFKKENDNA